MEYHETQLILGIKGLHRGDLAGEEVQKWNERVENERRGINGDNSEHSR